MLAAFRQPPQGPHCKGNGTCSQVWIALGCLRIAVATELVKSGPPLFWLPPCKRGESADF